MRQLMRRLAPTGFDDIAALNALYRPGPLSRTCTTTSPIARTAVSRELRPPGSGVDPRRDLGLMIYQEDIMRVATLVAASR